MTAFELVGKNFMFERWMFSETTVQLCFVLGGLYLCFAREPVWIAGGCAVALIACAFGIVDALQQRHLDWGLSLAAVVGSLTIWPLVAFAAGYDHMVKHRKFYVPWDERATFR